MKVRSVGVDIVDITRFRSALRAKKDRFIANNFSREECRYCLLYKDPGPHFAGTFAAKEAIQKAADLFDLRPVHIEIRRTPDGKPEVYIKGKISRSIIVSISHERRYACAFALYQP